MTSSKDFTYLCGHIHLLLIQDLPTTIMKILHTGDWHIGQIIYQYYDREEEHRYFFRQLTDWCRDEQPDAMIVAGDIFDTAQPTVTARRFYTEQMMQIRRACPDMPIVIIAGNHDSAGRIEAEAALWHYADIYAIGTAPAQDMENLPVNWQSKYIVEIPNKGYIVALPYYNGSRKAVIQSLLDYVADKNTAGLPVVEIGHQWVQGMATWGSEMGNLAEKGLEEFGQGYDYLALGHIHKPYTIGQAEDVAIKDYSQVLASPVARYSGSAVHVSASEKVPHSVSVVEIDHHGGEVKIRPLHIHQLLHFYTLPEEGKAIETEEELKQTLRAFVTDTDRRGYFRLRIRHALHRDCDPDKVVEQLIAGHEDKARFNPQTLYENLPDETPATNEEVVFEVEEFQQMTDPLTFIRKTINQYPNLEQKSLEDDFRLISARVRQMDETMDNNKQETL